MAKEANGNEKPERPTIIPIFGKRPPTNEAVSPRRRLNDDEVLAWLGEAAASGRWMIAMWFITLDRKIQYRRKNSDNFPHRDVRRMLAQLEEDDKIQAMVAQGDIEAREHDTGFAAQEE